ncbi:MAG TPA: 2-succinyl-5-enolpyruvyl-6-hydroxy-3-cyclohexene-1-carboxylic-acid synthase [Rhabdochlamydiaceae bacterium]|nr:2-succinyl-5-enolpyruvyl-6-hydroxy-3-cyclohexene-1-carboxylic-acid synthase [Rhabdochlamydiaceae bacterium]
MKEETGELNDRWAALIVDFLIQQKVDYFCLSPGLRLTPLAIAIANHPEAKAFIHFDERGSAFHALGYAKATGRPAAIVSTSGTAAGNLFPAIMEASLSYTPLIVLTADRPPELRNVADKQTADQVKLFGNYVRFAVDLPTPSPALSHSYLATTIAQSVFISLQAPIGPVHLNCMFREPLFSEKPMTLSSSPALNYDSCAPYPSDELLTKWATNLSQYEKGIILLGVLPEQINKSAIIDFAKKLKWPIFPDIFSGFRTDQSTIAYYDLILKSLPEMPAHALLHLGDRYVSKTVLEWLQRVKPKRCFQVIGHPLRADPAHMITDRVLCAPDVFCEALLPLIPEKDSTWTQQWKILDQKVEETLRTYFSEQRELSEASLFFVLQNCLSPETPLFLANSMPVRDAGFFLSQKTLGKFFGNRGVAGIDGNIATSVGLAQGLKSPLVSVIGDQAGLHDLNSLAQMKKADYPVTLIIINNKGGGIFSFLPISKKQYLFEEFFAASHEFSFESAAKLFDLPYYRFQQADDLSSFFQTPLQTSCLIEIETDRKENFHLHQEIYQKVQECLLSVSCTAF